MQTPGKLILVLSLLRIACVYYPQEVENIAEVSHGCISTAGEETGGFAI